jgi:hypothetical protein
LTVKHTAGDHPSVDGVTEPLDDYSLGILVGVLVGEGHFGGDGVRAQVTVRMHVRHERLFRWLEQRVPGSRLYGPYEHGGRRYFQWMVRGTALVDWLLPQLAGRLDQLDDHAAARLRAMRARYRLGEGTSPSDAHDWSERRIAPDG